MGPAHRSDRNAAQVTGAPRGRCTPARAGTRNPGQDGHAGQTPQYRRADKPRVTPRPARGTEAGGRLPASGPAPRGLAGSRPETKHEDFI